MKTNILVLFLFLFICFGCVKVEQEVSYDSRIDCTYYIITRLWVYEGFLWTGMHLEKSISEYAVKKPHIDSVKECQMEFMLPFKTRLEEAIKTECN